MICPGSEVVIVGSHPMSFIAPRTLRNWMIVLRHLPSHPEFWFSIFTSNYLQGMSCDPKGKKYRLIEPVASFNFLCLSMLCFNWEDVLWCVSKQPKLAGLCHADASRLHTLMTIVLQFCCIGIAILDWMCWKLNLCKLFLICWFNIIFQTSSNVSRMSTWCKG